MNLDFEAIRKAYPDTVTINDETGAFIQPDNIVSNVFANNVFSIFANDFEQRNDEAYHFLNRSNPLLHYSKVFSY